jgi:hypothetical protein
MKNMTQNKVVVKKKRGRPSKMDKILSPHIERIDNAIASEKLDINNVNIISRLNAYCKKAKLDTDQTFALVVKYAPHCEEELKVANSSTAIMNEIAEKQDALANAEKTFMWLEIECDAADNMNGLELLQDYLELVRKLSLELAGLWHKLTFGNERE